MKFFKSKNNFEINRYLFNKNYCDIFITGKEEFCDKIYDIFLKIEFEIFGKDMTKVPLINNYTLSLNSSCSINIKGAKENVKKFIDILKTNQEYQNLIKLQK